MAEYEMINMLTGEVETFNTQVDISLIEDYNRWVVENKINPPTFSPAEYAQYIENIKRKQAVDEVIEKIEFYNKGPNWTKEMVDSILRILRNEE